MEVRYLVAFMATDEDGEPCLTRAYVMPAWLARIYHVAGWTILADPKDEHTRTMAEYDAQWANRVRWLR